MCDVNHLESDVLLPPRKRLLAGFKKQISDGNGSSSPPAVASSSNASSTSSDVQTHLDNLMTSRMNDPNLTQEEIEEASRSAAIAAVTAAKAARATADEKAEIAANAMAAAKTALALVASFPEEATSKERYPKKNKLKRHVPVELLYTKGEQHGESHWADEELALRLHRAINSSRRILKTCSSSELKNRTHKKHKGLVISESSRFSNGHANAREEDTDSSNEQGNQLELDIMDIESNHSKEETRGGTNSLGRKRGRVKLKKLPLSKCNSKEEPSHSGKTPLFQHEGSKDSVMGVMDASTWKCQDLKAPECVKQNKVVHL